MHCHFLQVSSALNDEIRRLCIVVDEFDRPFHPDPILLNNYKKVNCNKILELFLCIISHVTSDALYQGSEGAQWLSGRVLDSRPRGCWFEPHWRHCVVVLEQGTLILA